VSAFGRVGGSQPAVEGHSASTIQELNFDVKGYCGAGAPRFNIVSGSNVAFLGCASGVVGPITNGYTHVEFTPAQIAAALATAGIAPTDTVDDLYVILDEIGTANIHNISVNNKVVGDPTSPTTSDDCKNGGYKSFYPGFKTQGDCVSFFATKGKNQPSPPKSVQQHA